MTTHAVVHSFTSCLIIYVMQARSSSPAICQNGATILRPPLISSISHRDLATGSMEMVSDSERCPRRAVERFRILS